MFSRLLDRYLVVLKRWCLYTACLLACGCVSTPQLQVYEHYHIPPRPVAVIVSGDLEDYAELIATLKARMVRTYVLFEFDS